MLQPGFGQHAQATMVYDGHGGYIQGYNVHVQKRFVFDSMHFKHSTWPLAWMHTILPYILARCNIWVTWNIRVRTQIWSKNGAVLLHIGFGVLARGFLCTSLSLWWGDHWTDGWREIVLGAALISGFIVWPEVEGGRETSGIKNDILQQIMSVRKRFILPREVSVTHSFKTGLLLLYTYFCNSKIMCKM